MGVRQRLQLLLLATGLVGITVGAGGASSSQVLPEDRFARRRAGLDRRRIAACVPEIASVQTDYAILPNGSRAHLGTQISGRVGCSAQWTLVLLAPALNDTHGAAVWEQHRGNDEDVMSIWGVGLVSKPLARGYARAQFTPIVLCKPVGTPKSIAYPSAMPPWFVGTYWREEVLPSATDVLADRLLLEKNVSYSEVAPVLPRLTGQMGEPIESVRHRGGPSFVSDPLSSNWWQVRQNGEIVVGNTVAREGTAALPVIHPAFRPSPLFAHPEAACEWPNHDGPGPTHGTACMHLQAFVDGWLPIISQGLRDTVGGSCSEQLILAFGDSLYIANRSGTANGAWRRWEFFWTLPHNSSHLESVSPSQFLYSVLAVLYDAHGFIASTALSESHLKLPAEPLLGDASRASILLARAAYTDLHPHYGVGSSYSAQVNDGFPPTTIAMAQTLCAVGAPRAAADRLGYFLHNLVSHTTGAVDYYGTAISEYGQLLQTAATVATGLGRHSPGAGRQWLTLNAVPLGRMAERIIAAQNNASAHRALSGGLLWGCPEADLCAQPEGQGLFFSSALWAWRGLVDLAAGMTNLGMTNLGNIVAIAEMNLTALQLRQDTLDAIAMSVDASSGWLPPCRKCTHSVNDEFSNMTQSRIASYTNYRFWPEMLSSGGLDQAIAEGLGKYRSLHGGELLAMTRFESWMDDWPLPNVALWWLDLAPNSSIGSADKYTLAMISHLAHHSTRGTFVAFEQANWADNQADNCVPSQLVVPMLLAHMLVHVTTRAEDRTSTIWIHRGVPRHWFASAAGGFQIKNVSVWTGAISTAVQVRSHSTTCTLTVQTPTSHIATTDCMVILHLGGDTASNFSSATVNGKPWKDLDLTNSVVRNVPCVQSNRSGETTTIITVTAASPPPLPPAPRPNPFPPQPRIPPRCNCSDASHCAFIKVPSKKRNVFAYLDDGGPPNDRDNWESAVKFENITHVIRNTHHPLLIDQDGGVVLNDALWPTTGKDSMLCTAHRMGVRVLADIDPLGFDAHHPDPVREEAVFLRNSSAVSRAAREIASWVTAAGYDGVGFDFEGLSVGSWSLTFEHEIGNGLIALVKETRAALRAGNSMAEVAFAVSTNNNKWFNESYRMGEITAEIDYTIVMCYDMWHRNTDAGPNSPIPAVTAALNSFIRGWRAPASKLVMGIGWYGYTYRCQMPVPDPLPKNNIYIPGLPPRPNCSAGVAPADVFPAPCCSPWAPYSFSAARTFEAQLANASANCSKKVSDTLSGSTVFECYQDGERFQTWYDDMAATATKARLAAQLDLGGMAIWTAGNAPSGRLGELYWKAIAAYSRPQSMPAVVSSSAVSLR